MRLILLFCLLVSCSTTENFVPSGDFSSVRVQLADDVAALNEQKKVDEKGRLKDLTSNGDSFMWQAKWCAVMDCSMDEYAHPEGDGRYCRDIGCRVHVRDENGKVKSNTSWSGDMGICGLAINALVQKDNDLVAQHVGYGEANDWVMGEIAEGLSSPKEFDAKTRVEYSGNLQNQMRNVRDFTRNQSMSKPHSAWFDTSKKDYQAHLQSCGMFLDGYMSGESTELMGKIVGIHHARVKGSAFYALLHGWFNGEWTAIKNICSSDGVYLGDYVRCDNSDACGWADKVFSCSMLLRFHEAGLAE